MKYVKRILCILLASLLLFMSPLSDYLDTSGMKKTEAMGTLTQMALLMLKQMLLISHLQVAKIQVFWTGFLKY